MDLQRIKAIAYEQLANRASHDWKEIGNKYYHGERVAKIAVGLRKRVLPDDFSHDDILTVAGWFHDIRNGEEHHSRLGAEVTRGLLKGLCTEDELDEICSIINVHDNRRGPDSEHSVYIKLQQDADLLDHFGTYDIWSAFIYAVPHNVTLAETVKFLLEEHPHDDAGWLEKLNFAVSREIYTEKSNFAQGFAHRFAAEADGEIYNMNGR